MAPPARFPAARTMRRLLVLGALLGALIGLFAGLLLDRSTVSSESQIVFSVGTGINGSADAAATENQYLGNRMTTYAELTQSDRVLGPAARQLGTTVDALRPLVTASATSGNTTLTLATRSADPEAAAAATRAVDGSLISTITAIETSPGLAPPIVGAVTSPPTVPAAPFTPPLGLAVAAGAVAGLVVALLAAAARATGLPQRATRAVLRWVFSTPAGAEPPRPPRPLGPPRPSSPPGPPAPVVPGTLSVPEQVRADSASDTGPSSAASTPTVGASG
ncbi:hypothetical protein LQ327_32685 [Actinomycetospora endophytica]|uniref:Capsular polysaccharide biosynthesis protein n=1 Tax=Actinomycetospora endophytica TaxID=2291215 RepID=A0ABS8PIM5_9PSEU|nr:hypothetical protein [Actinomycetospora endophytica]MCD2198137.1 hypothetical protein [Actinomycetospora endophytica]